MSKRMALIPEEIIRSYEIRNPETRIEDEMTKLLDSTSLPDDMKVKLLSQLITRYHKIVNEPSEPIPVKMQEPNDTIQKAKKSEDTPIDSMLRNILTSVPKPTAKFIAPILDKLKTRGISWNENGEMIRDQKTLKDTNIIDFFSYLMRNSKEQLEPRYFPQFLKAIKEVKIPVTWIGNKRLYKRLNEADESFDSESVEHTSARSEDREFSPTKRRRSKSFQNLSFEGESPSQAWYSRSHSPNQKWLVY